MEIFIPLEAHFFSMAPDSIGLASLDNNKTIRNSNGVNWLKIFDLHARIGMKSVEI